MKDYALICSLIDQVTKARPEKGSEVDVVTLITRPLWRKWNVATGSPPDAEPTQWLGLGKTNRVYGSETIVIDHPSETAVSYPRRNLSPLTARRCS